MWGMKRAAFGLLLLVVGLTVAVVWSIGTSSRNTQGVASSTAELPMFAAELKDLPAEGEIAWTLHRGMHGSYFFMVSSSATAEQIDEYCKRHRLEWCVEVSEPGRQWAVAEDASRNGRITGDFDRGDPMFSGREESLGYIRLYRRVRDNRYTMAMQR